MLASTRSRIIALALGGPVLFAGFISYRAFAGEYRDVFPAREPVTRPDPVPELAQMRDITFRTEDGLTLRGWFVPSSNGAAILLAHGYRANRTQMLPEARLFAQHGYGVLLFDLRAHGESDGNMTTYGDQERRDVRAGLDVMASQPGVDPNRLGALGFSAGAAPVAMVAAEDHRVRAVVLEAATTSMTDACLDDGGPFSFVSFIPALLGMMAAGVDVRAVRTVDAVRKIAPRSLLVVYGEKDPVISAKRPKAIYDAASEPKRLLMIRDAGHGGYWDADAKTYADALIAHLDASLLPRR